MHVAPLTILSAITVLAFQGLPASASGGIGCEARDARVALDVGIGVTRGSGGFFNVAGTLEITGTGLPRDLASLMLGDLLIHSWLDGEELKLQFYHERSDGEFASLDLVVEAEAIDEGTYGGRYVVSVFGVDLTGADAGDPWSIEGPVLCYVE